VYVHRPKGKEQDKQRKSMIFFHGGGACAGTPEMMKSGMNKYAAIADVNIINVEYRLAPEHKAPRGIADAYAVFMDVVTNPSKFGACADKVGIFGESGGGYITAGVGMMLAEKDQSHLCRF